MSYPDVDIEAVAADLSAIAHYGPGFDDPATLARKLTVVLDLSCVVEAAGQNVGSRAARTLALRSVLRQVVAGLERDLTRLTAQILLFLLDDQDIADLQLSPDLVRGGLHNDRRPLISELVSLPMNRIRKTEEPRIHALVAGELLRYEDRTRRLPSTTSQTPGSDDARTTRQVIRHALSSVYPQGARLTQLGAVLVPDRPVFDNALVDLRLIDLADSTYLYDLTLSFDIIIEEYVIAIVNTPALVDQILLGGTAITDLYVCASPAARQAHAEQLVKSSDAVLVIDASERAPRRRAVRLEPVPADELPRYLGDLPLSLRDEVTLLRGDARPYASGDAQRMRLQTRQQLHLNKHDHFCFWFADRPTYVHTLRVDASHLTLAKDHTRRPITAQLFMMASDHRTAFDDSGCLTFSLESWVLPGQGIAVSW